MQVPKEKAKYFPSVISFLLRPLHVDYYKKIQKVETYSVACIYLGSKKRVVPTLEDLCSMCAISHLLLCSCILQ